MSSTSNNDALDAVLEKDFPAADVEYHQQKLGGTIHVFLIRFSNSQALQDGWRRLSNAIAVYFQTKLPDEFGKWNTYLFFINTGPVNRDLKYKIENDTFSSRKIVIENDMDFQEIIQKHVLNGDLKVAVKQAPVAQEEFVKNPIIAKALENKTVSGKSTYRPDAKDVLQNIRSTLKSPKDAI